MHRTKIKTILPYNVGKTTRDTYADSKIEVLKAPIVLDFGFAEAEIEDLGGVLGGSGTVGVGIRHRPEELTTLAAKTRFTRKEIQMIYRGFKQECPTGYVDEDAFKHIFSQFFPQGGEFYARAVS